MKKANLNREGAKDAKIIKVGLEDFQNSSWELRWHHRTYEGHEADLRRLRQGRKRRRRGRRLSEFG